MKLENSFIVPVAIPEAWELLLDPERVAGCLPGARLESVDGDELRGSVKVKLGPMAMSYKGSARFRDRDDRAYTVSMDAAGKDARGAGSVKATMHMALTEDDGGTRCNVSTDLAVTGKAAQFGRGVMAEVSSKVIDEFARRLAAEVQGTAKTPAPRSLAVEMSATDDEALDLLGTVGWQPIARAAAPLMLAVAAIAALVIFRRMGAWKGEA